MDRGLIAGHLADRRVAEAVVVPVEVPGRRVQRARSVRHAIAVVVLAVADLRGGGVHVVVAIVAVSALGHRERVLLALTGLVDGGVVPEAVPVQVPEVGGEHALVHVTVAVVVQVVADLDGVSVDRGFVVVAVQASEELVVLAVAVEVGHVEVDGGAGLADRQPGVERLGGVVVQAVHHVGDLRVRPSLYVEEHQGDGLAGVQGHGAETEVDFVVTVGVIRIVVDGQQAVAPDESQVGIAIVAAVPGPGPEVRRVYFGVAGGGGQDGGLAVRAQVTVEPHVVGDRGQGGVGEEDGLAGVALVLGEKPHLDDLDLVGRA